MADCVKCDDNLSQNGQHCSSMATTACYSPVTAAAPPGRSSWWLLLQPLDQNKLTFFLLEAFRNCPFTPDLFDVYKWKMFCNFVLKTIKPAFWCSTGLFWLDSQALGQLILWGPCATTARANPKYTWTHCTASGDMDTWTW